MDLKELQVSTRENVKQNHPWEYARSKVVLRILKNYLKEQAGGVALDVGCGDVFFLCKFADKYPNFELVAVDTAFDEEIISKIAAQNSKYSIQFFKDIENVTNIKEAKIVFLLDVIEHIEDDISFLKELASQAFINPNTVFAITVPAFNGLYCNHDEWLGHYRRYSQTTLKQHTKAAGLTCIEGGYFFTSLLFPRFVQKIIEKVTKHQSADYQGIGNYEGGAVLSFLYEKFLLIDFYFFRAFRFLGIKIPGLSTYIICKKQEKQV